MAPHRVAVHTHVLQPTRADGSQLDPVEAMSFFHHNTCDTVRAASGSLHRAIDDRGSQTMQRLADQHDELRREYDRASSALITEMRAVESTAVNATFNSKDELLAKLQDDRQHFGTTITELRTLIAEGFAKLERKQVLVMRKTRKIENTLRKRSVYLGKRSHEDMILSSPPPALSSSSSGSDPE